MLDSVQPCHALFCGLKPMTRVHMMVLLLCSSEAQVIAVFDERKQRSEAGSSIQGNTGCFDGCSIGACSDTLDTLHMEICLLRTTQPQTHLDKTDKLTDKTDKTDKPLEKTKPCPGLQKRPLLPTLRTASSIGSCKSIPGLRMPFVPSASPLPELLAPSLSPG